MVNKHTAPAHTDTRVGWCASDTLVQRPQDLASLQPYRIPMQIAVQLKAEYLMGWKNGRRVRKMDGVRKGGMEDGRLNWKNLVN